MPQNSFSRSHVQSRSRSIINNIIRGHEVQRTYRCVKMFVWTEIVVVLMHKLLSTVQTFKSVYCCSSNSSETIKSSLKDDSFILKTSPFQPPHGETHCSFVWLIRKTNVSEEMGCVSGFCSFCLISSSEWSRCSFCNRLKPYESLESFQTCCDLEASLGQTWGWQELLLNKLHVGLYSYTISHMCMEVLCSCTSFLLNSSFSGWKVKTSCVK